MEVLIEIVFSVEMIDASPQRKKKDPGTADISKAQQRLLRGVSPCH